MLTKRQAAVLGYLLKYQRDSEGLAPTIREIGSAFSMRLQSVQHVLWQLEDRGYIRRLPNRARGIEVLRGPRTEFFVFDNEAKELRPLRGNTTAVV